MKVLRRFGQWIGVFLVFFWVAAVFGYAGSDYSRGETIQIEPVVAETRPTTEGEESETENEPPALEESGDTTEIGQDSTTAITVPQEEAAGENLVWVPTNGGTKYHSNAGCSNMNQPIQVSVETAELNGFSPCKRCY